MDSKTIEKFKNIKLLAMDFDGVLTDGLVYVDENGTESVRCSRRDSLGLNMLKKIGIKIFVISKEENPVVTARCKKLDIECYQGVNDSEGKKDILASLANREGVPLSQVAFIGDDVNDVGALEIAGVGVTVADSHDEVKKHTNVILTRNGGQHAVRELCDLILIAQGTRVSY